MAVEFSEVHRLSGTEFQQMVESGALPQYWVFDVESSRVIVHRDPVANAYRYHQELGPGKLLDGSFLGIGEISVADVLGAA